MLEHTSRCTLHLYPDSSPTFPPVFRPTFCNTTPRAHSTTPQLARGETPRSIRSMADEWWSSTSHRSHGTSACSPAPLSTDRVSCVWTYPTAATESTSSLTIQDPYKSATHLPVSDAASSLGDLRMDWTQAFLSGRSDASFQAVLQDDMARAHPTADEAAMNNPLIRGMNDGFLLDQALLESSQQALLDATAAHSILMYGNNQPSAGYDAMAATQLSQLLKPSVPASTPMQGGGAQMQQYLSGSYLPFSGPLPSQLLLQALQPKLSSRSSNANNLMVKSNSGLAHQDSCSPATRKSVSESPAPAKRPRIEAPSPLPTFKVRKEKLGDRITALQQLVSPFGKTDTASVLHEAIDYIKILHEQVASLSSPYLKSGIPFQRFQKGGAEDAKENGDAKQDLRSLGLCLVPVANTYTVASETVPEFWHPTFGGTLR